MPGREHAAAEHHVDRLVEDAEPAHGGERKRDDLLGLAAYDPPRRPRRRRRRPRTAPGVSSMHSASEIVAEVDGLDQVGHARRGRSGAAARRSARWPGPRPSSARAAHHIASCQRYAAAAPVAGDVTDGGEAHRRAVGEQPRAVDAGPADHGDAPGLVEAGPQQRRRCR